MGVVGVVCEGVCVRVCVCVVYTHTHTHTQHSATMRQVSLVKTALLTCMLRKLAHSGRHRRQLRVCTRHVQSPLNDGTRDGILYLKEALGGVGAARRGEEEKGWATQYSRSNVTLLCIQSIASTMLHLKYLKGE